MVKNRKPMFVSEAAKVRIAEMAKEWKCFGGDVVDILTGVKTIEDLNNDFQKETRGFSKRAGRVLVETTNVG